MLMSATNHHNPSSSVTMNYANQIYLHRKPLVHLLWKKLSIVLLLHFLRASWKVWC